MDPDAEQRIIQIVYDEGPLTIAELTRKLQKSGIRKDPKTVKNWVEEMRSSGKVGMRIFKVGRVKAWCVYWDWRGEKLPEIMRRLEGRIMTHGPFSEGFSALDLYQHVPQEFKSGGRGDPGSALEEDVGNAKISFLMLRGDLSFASDQRIQKLLLELSKRLDSIYIVGRIDVGTFGNAEELVSMNQRIGRKFINLRHFEQPLRANVIDGKYFSMLETRGGRGVIYRVWDERWVKWMEGIFWRMYNSGQDAMVRIREIKALKGV